MGGISDLGIEELVEFVNTELRKGLSTNKIADKYGMKRGTLKTKLSRGGYSHKADLNCYTKDIQEYNGEEIQKYNEDISEVKTTVEPKVKKDIQKDNKSITKTTEPKMEVIQKYNKDINLDVLKELIDLIDPIKEVIQEYNKSKTIIEVKTPELKPKAVIEVKQKLFKIDTEVLEQWESFVADHKEFKVQQLISLAIEEFIDKYK